MNIEDSRTLEKLLKDSEYKAMYCVEWSNGMVDNSLFESFEECSSTNSNYNITISRILPIIYRKDKEEFKDILA